jgi:hypothetical protein
VQCVQGGTALPGVVTVTVRDVCRRSLCPAAVLRCIQTLVTMMFVGVLCVQLQYSAAYKH